MSRRADPRRALASAGRTRVVLLAVWSGLGALGLILVAQGVAGGIASVVDGDRAWRTALWWGGAGVVLRAVSGWASAVTAARTALGVKADLRARLVDHIVRRPRRRVGAATVLATDGLDDLDEYYRVFLPALVASVTVPLLIGLRILTADRWSALVIVLTVPLVPLFMTLIGMHTRDRVAARLDALDRLSDHLVELARGLPVLVGLGRVREQADALADISERHRRAAMGTLRSAFASSFALELIATVSVAVVAVFIGLRLVNGSMDLQVGLLVLVLAPECYLPLRRVGTAFHASQDGLAVLERVEDVLDEAPPSIPMRRTGTQVVARNLTVRFPGRRDPVVQNLDLVAPTGETTLLAGPSGCGKSTVLGLLAGTAPAEVEVTGALTAPAPVAWLAQHPRTIAATPAEELAAYGVDDPDRVRDLLQRVGLLTVADTDTAWLSPGELRRLAFARVLARVAHGARLVLLDEPTAHLDPVNARRIRAEIAGLRRRVTVVVASHDPAVQALADHVVRLGAGPVGAAPTVEAAPEPVGGQRTNLAPGPTVAATPPSRRQVLGELLAFLGPARWRFAAAVVVAAVATGFAIALTAVSGWLIVRASAGVALMYLMVAIVGVRFFGVGRAALHYVDRLLTHDAVFRALTPLRSRIWAGLAARGPADRSLLVAGGTLGALVADADQVRDLTPRVVTPPAVALVVWAGTTVALGIVLPAAGVVVAVTGLVALVVPAGVSLVTERRAGPRADAVRARALTQTAALFNAADDVRANGVADAARERLIRLDAEREQIEQRTAWATGIGDAAVIVCWGAATFVMLPVAVSAVGQGTLGAAMVAVLVLTPLGLVDTFSDVVAAALRWPTLAQVLGRVRTVTHPSGPTPGGTRTLTRARHLELVGVGYRYPGGDRDVLSDVHTRAGPGRWLVVTGPSGSGKSTLLALLLRYIDPDVGRYDIEGHPATGFIPDRVRDRIAWCPQEAHLFDSTLRANLLLARARTDAPDDHEMQAVLERVGLGDWLGGLEAGLDTPIGPAGAALSGGQRQRVAVARTLLARADTVLVDEPTAHLDAEAADALVADLRIALADKTTVLVTHGVVAIEPGDHTLDLHPPPSAKSGADSGPVGRSAPDFAEARLVSPTGPS